MEIEGRQEAEAQLVVVSEEEEARQAAREDVVDVEEA
jgi:hypothetical protein